MMVEGKKKGEREMTSFPHIEAAGLEITPKGNVKIACWRCGGSGHYSFNYMDGTICYGCMGKGHNGYVPAAEYELKLKKREQGRKYRAKKKAAKEAARKAEADAKRGDFLDANPGLAKALQGEHSILVDLAAKLQRWGELSPKQVDLAFKLAAEATTCRECGHGKHEFACEHEGCSCINKAEIEEGRRTMEGKVLTVRQQESHWGTTTKMLVKLTTGEKLWGSVPRTVKTLDGADFDTYDYDSDTYPLKGCRIRFVATVEVSKDDRYFGFFKRPTKAVVIEVVQ
jgi:hypothetical protein